MDGRQSGTVKAWIEDRGMGFITPQGGGIDHFVHRSMLTDGLSLQVGAPVSFIPTWDAMKDKPIASQLTGASAGPGTAGGSIPGKAPAFVTPSINFGVRGDDLLQTRADNAKTKKNRTFKTDFETQFWGVFGNCHVDHSITPGENLSAVFQSIATGPSFDILCVGIGIQDLMDQEDWKSKVVPVYPASLDTELQQLAAAIKAKSNGSMVWVGGPAEFWGRLPRWDTYMEHARNTLRRAGVQVVPSETVAFVFQQLTLSDDGHHIANMDHEKETFGKAWATCLYAAASDPTWGLAVTEEPDDPTAGAITEEPLSKRPRQ